jgi:hypothetical protein
MKSLRDKLKRLFRQQKSSAPPESDPNAARSEAAQRVLRQAQAQMAGGLRNDSAEIQEAWRFLQGNQPEQAFALLNTIKRRRLPVRDTDYLRAVYFLVGQQLDAAAEALKEELRFFSDHAEASALLKPLLALSQPANAPEHEPEFAELLKSVRPYTMLSEARLHSLYQRAKTICERNIPGNFAECGVAAGGSSALLAAVISRYSTTPRRLYSFDTFEGMPPATSEDTHEGQHAEQSGWGTGTCAAPEASLMEACRKLGVEDLVHPVKGLFSETLPETREQIGSIALLHVDGDWYASTRDVLGNLYDQVVQGGFIQIDDYGYWEGCRRAVEEFQRERGLTFQLHTIDETGVWLAK